PPNAPAWFTDAHASMTHIDLGCHYRPIVAAWTRMEAASRFEHSESNLSAKSRPKSIGVWIRSKRTAAASINDPVQYAEEWRAWWDLLQPSWRTKDKDGQWAITATYGGAGREWGPLYRWGINGILTVVASLYFWGCVVQGKPEFLGSWERAVQDV
ncbi:hypothetical protein R3P38DRAFT_2378051, partial [Favolaschia claudopus]